MKILRCFALLLAGCVRHPVVKVVPDAQTSRGPEPQELPAAQTVTKPAVLVVDVPPHAPNEVKLPPVKDEGAAIAAVNTSLEDAYFAYDRSELTPAALATLRKDAELLCAILEDFPALRVLVEGHCDERGSAAYNLGLGDERARGAEQILREYGVPAAAMQAISYGKEAPQCTEANESCWQRNRRAHLAVKREGASR